MLGMKESLTLTYTKQTLDANIVASRKKLVNKLKL